MDLAAAPSLPAQYLAGMQKLEIGLNSGSCGSAAFLGETVVSEHIAVDPLWAGRREAAAQAGIKSAWSQPIFSSSGKVLGVCTAYYAEPHRPTQSEVQQIEQAAYLAGIAIERSKSEATIRKSEEELRLITDSLPVLISYVDNEERYQFNNKEYEEWFGLPRDHVVGRHIKEIIGDEAYEHVAPHVKQALSGETVQYERYVVKADGAIRVAENQLIPHITSDGLVRGFFTLVNDVTEKRLGEQALRESEARLQTLIESLLFDLWFCDVEGRFLLQNSFSKRRWGQLQGKLPSEAQDPDAVLSELAELNRRALAGEIINREATVREGQEERTYQMIIAPVLDSGAAIGICGVKLDITDRKRAEENVRANEARLRMITEQLPALLWTTDRDLRVTYNVYSNRSDLKGATMFALGQTLYDAFETADEEYLPIAMHLKALSGMAVSYQFEFGDQIFDVQLEPLMSSQGLIVGCIGLGLNITERTREQERKREMEQRLQESHQLESLGLLAGGIAHDFNNLLMGVLGNAGLALLDLQPESIAASRVRDIERTAQHAAELTNQLLAYAGRGRFVVQPINLSEISREMAALLRTAISKRVELKYDLDFDLPLVEADVTQIRQVIMNLITNGSDALGGAAGYVTIRTGKFNAAGEHLRGLYGDAGVKPGPYVYLEVSDTGCGMDGDTVKRIFDPFFSTKFAGRGLGLSAVLGIVRGHHGALRVQSRPGAGTTISVLFPVSDLPVPKRETEVSSPPPPEASGTILVVDDEETVREVAASMLVQYGYQVMTASDGDEAVELLAQHNEKISAVILDMTMPRLSGEQAFYELRKVRANIPVLLSSGYHPEETTNFLADQSLVAFVQKPYGPPVLLHALAELLAKARGDFPRKQ